ncbi:MAG: hypothetical protein Q4A07_05510 [Coriobacteriales bacterium]|nr:hypothetical protein [Coriobacteriales bacterium]
MSITLSHQSALDVVRMLRTDGTSIQEMDYGRLAKPSSWVGKRLDGRSFASPRWRWPQPKAGRPLHVFVPEEAARMRGVHMRSHVSPPNLPPHSILWLDEFSSVVCPELLFVQMAQTFSLPMLVMLGHELCGHFSRCANNPCGGPVAEDIPAATSVERLSNYLGALGRARGLPHAKKALRYIGDHALSVPEAVLATIYALPASESGYGMGPVTLNERVVLGDASVHSGKTCRYPDIMFSFAPVGINYDGEGHLDLSEVQSLVTRALHASSNDRPELEAALRKKLVDIRAKVVDDNVRGRQLAARGRVVFPVTKEDVENGDCLDELTLQLLFCARTVFGADTSTYEKTLNDTLLKRDRDDLLDALTSRQRYGESSYGSM